jgi:hypothetical protein
MSVGNLPENVFIFHFSLGGGLLLTNIIFLSLFFATSSEERLNVEIQVVESDLASK